MGKEFELEKKDLALDQRTETEVEKVEKDIDMLSKVTFLDSLLDKQTEIRSMLDVRANIVIGFNSALIVILASTNEGKLAHNPLILTLLGILILSLGLAIVALKPPHFSTKKGQKESLFYHHYINGKSIEDYRKEIHGALKNKEDIFNAYITEVYNMTCYSNIPRKAYLYASIKVLIYGVLLIVITYGLYYLLTYFSY